MRKADAPIVPMTKCCGRNSTKYIDITTIQHRPASGTSPGYRHGEKNPTYMYGVNVALVEVDVNTGKTKVLRFTCVSDVGVIGNRLAVEGQAYGGISHSIVLLERGLQCGEQARQHGGLRNPAIDMIPDDINLLFLETPRPADHTAPAAAPSAIRAPTIWRSSMHQQRLWCKDLLTACNAG
jgi:CO/xanthine dehydrogenase Mo-binding subunit